MSTPASFDLSCLLNGLETSEDVGTKESERAATASKQPGTQSGEMQERQGRTATNKESNVFCGTLAFKMKRTDHCRIARAV